MKRGGAPKQCATEHAAAETSAGGMAAGKEDKLNQIKKLFAWPHVLLLTIISELGLAAVQSSLLGWPTTLGTSFSGLGTVEQGLRYVEQFAGALGLTMSIRSVSAVDWSNACREALKCVTGDACIFDDVLGRTKANAKKFRRLRDVGSRIKYMKKVAVVTKARCHRHGKLCRCPRPDVEMAGYPCPAHSRIGLRKGGLSNDFQCLLSWARVQINNNTPLLIHENVVGFALELMHLIFGKHYDIVRLKVSPKHAGFGKLVRRERVYDVLIHRQRAKLDHDVEKLYAATATRMRDNGVKTGCFMLAAPEEVNAFETATALRRKRGSVESPTDKYTKMQNRNLKLYRKMFKNKFGKKRLRTAYFHLNDNPSCRCVWSGSTGCLPTLRRAMGPIHSMAANRQVMPREALTAMGFVAYDFVAEATGLPMVLPASVLNSRTVSGMTGNAMHLANATIVAVVAMACVSLTSQEETNTREQTTPSHPTSDKTHTVADLQAAFKAFIQAKAGG